MTPWCWCECVRRWWCACPTRPLEDLYDDHTAAAAGAWRTQVGQRSGIIELSSCRYREQLPGTRDIVFAAGAGEEAVVPNAMEALRQNVEQKATNEFARAEGPWCVGARRESPNRLDVEHRW